ARSLPAAPEDAGADAGDAATPARCAADDARAEGACNALLDGFRWDGRNCVPLGQGCSCAGADCGGLASNLEDCVRRHLACYTQGCAPQPVHETFCAQCGFGRVLVFWDGVGCFEMDVCTCAGEGCDEPFTSVTECLTVMEQCDSSRCQATGGVYYPATPCGPCGDLVCGEPAGDDCCTSGCDCGAGRTFVPALGCQPDPTCTHGQLCRGSGGTWHPAEYRCISCGDYVCGEAPSGENCCPTGCDCGPHRNFVEAEGCQVDPTCPATREEKCAATGGRVDPGCTGYVCGERFSLGACDLSGCDCGPQANWDEAAGCVVAAECLTRQVGDTCSGWEGSSNCRPGLVCCAQCGIPDGCLICQMPEPCCHVGDPGCDAACPPPPP
ncbi:MAG: hypothetical protein HY906_06140, partial [Deltaproteobacteria bacterium]|nr:hypothetical protein [Deltaproteobacteria bacterium]